MQTLPPEPREIEPSAATLLRDAAARAGFNHWIFRVIGLVGSNGWKAAARAALARLPSPACATFVRFFLIRDELPQAVLDEALGGPEVLPALERAGLAARTTDGSWLCPVVLNPASDLFAFSDPIDDPASLSPPDDYILPVGGSTRFVDDLAVREPCGLAVDLGCGQGFLSLRALGHASRCIATDINPRALAFTRANASLNGAGDRIECRLGSLFEPLGDVEGKVDLLTCNPPFIIQPGGNTKAAVTSMEGDSMFEHIVRRIPSMLREGGWATVIGIWAHGALQEWETPVRAWLSGGRVDALLLRFRTYPAGEYLQNWFPPAMREASEPGWRTLCETRGIGAVTFGGLVLRRRPGPNWVRAMLTLINIRTGGASAQLRAYFKTQTILQAMPTPGMIMNRRLRSAVGWRFDPNLPMPTASPPGRPAGLALPLVNAAQYESLIAAFEGKATARQVVTQMHRSGLAPPPDHPTAVATVHSLAACGCLDIVD